MVIRRMLYLHGMFLPPRVYKDAIMKQFLHTLEHANWEVIFLHSPRVSEDTPPSMLDDLVPDLQQEEMCEWVNSKTHDDGSKEYLGLEESLSFIQSYLTDQPPFDIIAGHSNGALMASILALYMESQEGESWLPKEKQCAGILCMNAPNSYETEKSLGSIVSKHGPIAQIPSIHVYGGASDFAFEGSQNMKRVHHPSGQTFQHEAGHFFPKDQQCYDGICKALEKVVEGTA